MLECFYIFQIRYNRVIQNQYRIIEESGKITITRFNKIKIFKLYFGHISKYTTKIVFIFQTKGFWRI